MASRVLFYTKERCPLCDEAREVIDAVRSAAPFFELEEVDVLADADAFERYGELIPVVLVGPREFRYRITAGELLEALSDTGVDP